MKKRIVWIALAAVLLTAAALIWVGTRAPMADTADEIRLRIQLDLQEDIGLLIIDSSIGENSASGGISNADKSMLRRDDVLYWSIDPKQYAGIADPFELSLRFTVVTEYCDPNYENIYPEEYLTPPVTLSLQTERGATCAIRLVGDRTNGYRAIPESADD